jgi:hypothetical protein
MEEERVKREETKKTPLAFKTQPKDMMSLKSNDFFDHQKNETQGKTFSDLNHHLPVGVSVFVESVFAPA